MRKNRQLIKAIKEVTNKPIKYVINTHDHNDHKGANSFYTELGAIIVSNNNGLFQFDNDYVTSDNTYSIDMGNETIDLYHFTAHSNNDVIIFFNENITKS